MFEEFVKWKTSLLINIKLFLAVDFDQMYCISCVRIQQLFKNLSVTTDLTVCMILRGNYVTYHHFYYVTSLTSLYPTNALSPSCPKLAVLSKGALNCCMIFKQNIFSMRLWDEVLCMYFYSHFNLVKTSIITSLAKEVMFLVALVCLLFAINITKKQWTDYVEFF